LAQSVHQVRDPQLFFRLLDDLNIAYPSVSFNSPIGHNCLLKRADMEGGLGVSCTIFGSENDLDAGCYFQQKVDGLPFSVLFLADGKSSRIVGFNTQWVVADNPSQPYLFQGMANRYDLSDQNQRLIEKWITSIVVETGLQGLNSIDCLDVDGELFVLEINPRPSASVTLYDLDYAHGLLAEHINCFTGEAWSDAQKQGQVRGMWVVYAPADLQIHKHLKWPPWVSDRPVINSVFNCGEPLCTLQASADTVTLVKHKLMQRCAMITNLLLDSSRKFESSMS
jgi:predicted ATP-grasp superfamily ATP-dependent carboligase